MSDASLTASLVGLSEAELQARMRAEIERRTAATPAMLHCATETGDLVSVSDAWLSRLGYSRDEVLGRPFVDFLAPESKERALRQAASDFQGVARCDNVQYQMVKKDGGVLDVLLSAVLEEDRFGHGRVSLAVVTDISALIETRGLLAEANRRLYVLAEQDDLTGLASRRAFDEALTSEYQRARRDDFSLAVIMIEIDRFEAFNDLYGAPAGDNCLKLIARAIAGAVRRSGDVTARYSGREFAVLLPGAQEAGAMSVAVRIQQAVLRVAIGHKGNPMGIATVSVGISSIWPATSTETQDSLMQDAARGLSAAKHRRENSIVLASATETPMTLATAAAA